MGPDGRFSRAVALPAVCLAALLSFAGSASAATFAADPGSLGQIPDGPFEACSAFGANRDVTFGVSGVSGPITDLAVSMVFSPAHPAVGNLSVALIAPGGAPAREIFARTGAQSLEGPGYSSNLAGPYTFADTAPASPSWWQAAADANFDGGVISPGSYRASLPGEQASPPAGANALLTPTFAAATASGTWTLRFRDKCGYDVGSVAAATLTLTGTPPSTTGGRAAALKKCKKKLRKNGSKKRFKKCKKRATLLPA